MTDTIRCREKHQESYHLGTAALLWVWVSVTMQYVATYVSVSYVFFRVCLGMGVDVCLSMQLHACVCVTYVFSHGFSGCGCVVCMHGSLCGWVSLMYGVSLGVGVCHFGMGFLWVWVSVTQVWGFSGQSGCGCMFASVCHLGMGGFWVWVYVCIFVSLRYGFFGGVGVCLHLCVAQVWGFSGCGLCLHMCVIQAWGFCGCGCMHLFVTQVWGFFGCGCMSTYMSRRLCGCVPLRYGGSLGVGVSVHVGVMCISTRTHM